MGLPSLGKTLFGLPDLSLANYVMRKNQPKPPEINFPDPPPPPPRLDEAAMREEMTRKAMRRKGRMRNIFSSPTTTARPSVAMKTLAAG